MIAFLSYPFVRQEVIVLVSYLLSKTVGGDDGQRMNACKAMMIMMNLRGIDSTSHKSMRETTYKQRHDISMDNV
jgi:hypothetical protein